jgi:hypothetical protein
MSCLFDISFLSGVRKTKSTKEEIMLVKCEGNEVEVTGAWVYTDNVFTSWSALEEDVKSSINGLVADIKAKTESLKSLIESAPTDDGYMI